MEQNYDYGARKVVAVLSADLDGGVAVNVLGHLALAVGAHAENNFIMGRDQLIDGSGVSHTGISRYPVIVTKVKNARLRRVVEEARALSDVLVVDYPQQMLTTGHDDELAAELAAVDEREIRYLGVILYGPSQSVDSVTGKFTLWR